MVLLWVQGGSCLRLLSGRSDGHLVLSTPSDHACVAWRRTTPFLFAHVVDCLVDHARAAFKNNTT